MTALAFLLAGLLAPAQAQGPAPRQNVIEALTEGLRRDPGFTRQEAADLLAAVRRRFAAYALDVVRPERAQGIAVVQRMMIEGHFDGASWERVAEVSFAAYQAISRGAPPDVVEGIALYGYRKKISGERISTWANGYNHLIQGKVSPEVAADLVRVAMENDWEDSAFNTFKWALVEARKEGFNIQDYAVYLFGNMLAGKRRPGELTAAARTYFRKLAKTKAKPELPEYEGVFNRKPPPEIVFQAVPEASPEVSGEPPAPEALPESPAPDAVPDAEVMGDTAKVVSPPPSAAAPPALPSPTPKIEFEQIPSTPQESSPAISAPEPAAPKAQSAPIARAAPPRPAAPAPSAVPAAPPPAPAPRIRPLTHRPATPEELGLAMAKLWPGLEGSVKSYLGTPYVWGGANRKGIDCSALTQNSYGENKVGIPRVSRQQWKTGQKIEWSDLREGDLVFFNTMGVGVSHVGMLVSRSGTRFIHASSSRGVVSDDLTKRYYKARYLGARRIIP